ncbi:MAG: hypothetical protein U0175_08025 [Caldilineaceae bacterium]
MLELITKRRGELKNQSWLDTKRVEIAAIIPLSEIIDFYNELKHAPKATPAWTTPSTNIASPTWSSSTCSSTSSQWMH